MATPADYIYRWLKSPDAPRAQILEAFKHEDPSFKISDFVESDLGASVPAGHWYRICLDAFDIIDWKAIYAGLRAHYKAKGWIE